MPEKTSSLPEAGFKVYRCTPLPSCLQPLVIICWRSYPHNGDPLFDLLSFIVTEEAVLKAKGTDVYPRHLRDRDGSEVTIEDAFAVVYDTAQADLEHQARQEFATVGPNPRHFQPVELTEVPPADFKRLALRPTWADRWKEIRRQAPYTPLKSALEELDYSPLMKIVVEDLAAE